MKNILIIVFSILVLSACGKSEARKECERAGKGLGLTKALINSICDAEERGSRGYNKVEKHGNIVTNAYFPGARKTYIQADENYNNGKLDGVQKYFKNFLFTEFVVQESEIIYEDGTAISGWTKQFNSSSGDVIQEIALVKPDSHMDYKQLHLANINYPAGLVPEGTIHTYNKSDHEPTGGVEVWRNGLLIKFSNEDYGVYTILSPTSPEGQYISVSRSEYLSHGASTTVTKNTTTQHNESCIDSWISGYRDELGTEAAITNSQIQEWEMWCEDGQVMK